MSTLAVIDRPPDDIATAMEARAEPAPVAAGAATASLAMALLFVASLPDAMVPPVLRGLLIDRYGASAAAAHWFMAVNLVGALMAIPILAAVRRRLSPARLLVAAAFANAVLLFALAWPVGLGFSLLLRTIEGAADLLVVAVLFDMISKSTRPKRRGRRLGAAGTLLLTGLACGAMIGGWLGRIDATLIFVAGGAACLALAAAALFSRRQLDRLVRFCPATEVNLEAVPLERPLWPALGMVASDRALAGVLTATVPLYLSQAIALSPAQLGGLLAVPLAMMALGAWPAGWLGDRVGHLRLRTIAALFYAAAFTSIPLVAAAGTSALTMLAPMALIGLAGAALMPTSLAIAGCSSRGSVAMGACHAAGSAGFLAGILGAGALLGLLSAIAREHWTYAGVIAAFAMAHLLVTSITAVALRGRAIETDRGSCIGTADLTVTQAQSA